MAKKPTLTTVSSGYNSAGALNTDLRSLRDGFDNTLSLDGSTPNAMQADLDLNSNDILNVGNLFAESVTIDGTVITVGNVAGVDYPYSSRALAAADNVDSSITTIKVSAPSGVTLYYRADANGTALTTADGRTWSPDGNVMPDHWAENTPNVTDMTSAISAALAWVSDKGMGDVYLQGNVYRCSTPITVPKVCGARLIGASLNKATNESSSTSTAATEIRAGAAMSRLFAWDGDATVTNYAGLGKSFGIEHCIVNGNSLATYLFDSLNVDDFQCHDNRLLGSSNILRSTFNGTYTGSNLPGGHRISRNNFGATSGTNIEIDGHTQDWIDGNWFAQTGAAIGIKITRCDKINIVNNELNMGSGTVFELNDSSGSEATKEIVIVANKINAGTADVIVDNRTNASSKRIVFVGNAIVGGVAVPQRSMHTPETNVFSHAQDEESITFASRIKGTILDIETTSPVGVDLVRDGPENMAIKASNDSDTIYFGMNLNGNFAVDDDSSLDTGPALELDPTTGQLTIAETLRFVPPVSGAVGSNGQATFDSPSNTEFRILRRGSDGVLRSATITLA